VKYFRLKIVLEWLNFEDNSAAKTY